MLHTVHFHVTHTQCPSMLYTVPFRVTYTQCPSVSHTAPLAHCTLTTLPWTSLSVSQDLSPSTNSASLGEYDLLTFFCALAHLITTVNTHGCAPLCGSICVNGQLDPMDSATPKAGHMREEGENSSWVPPGQTSWCLRRIILQRCPSGTTGSLRHYGKFYVHSVATRCFF